MMIMTGMVMAAMTTTKRKRRENLEILWLKVLKVLDTVLQT